MEVGILSMRYAKAMIEYAQEKGVEDKLYQEFLTLSYCFCAQPGLRVCPFYYFGTAKQA